MTEPATLPGLDRVETPAYVYDLDAVRRAHGMLRAALPEPSHLLYSLKANPHPAVVRTLAELGCGAEICSPGELDVALRAGVAPDRMLYTGPGKRDADVVDAVKAGVRWFSVDSPEGLRQARRAGDVTGSDVRCLLRVNDRTPVADAGLAMTGVPSQFGADAEWVRAEPAAFREGLSGLHYYLGSNLDDEAALLAQFAAAVRSARHCADALGVQPCVLDLGGGFGAPYARAGDLPRFGSLAERLADLLDGAFPGWRDGRPIVAFESGRYLAATCGALLTRVLDVKRSHGRRVVVLESGINHLGGMSGLRRLAPIVPDVLPMAGGDPGQPEETIVAGPLCTPLDTWSRAGRVGPARPGDVVRVPNVGAYGLSASLVSFLSHPAPREVVVDGGVVTEVSQLVTTRRHAARDEVAGQ